jgi:hypothetical protein
LKRLKNLIEEIETDQEVENNDFVVEKVDEASKILVTLRYLTIDVIDAIVLWRERLNYLISKVSEASGVDKHDFVFTWDHENYLMKIKNDTLFLKDSSLSAFFHFSTKSDPFLIIPSQVTSNSSAAVKLGKKKVSKVRKVKKEPRKPELIRLDLDFALVKKIKQLELVLVEEAVSDFYLTTN